LRVFTSSVLAFGTWDTRVLARDRGRRASPWASPEGEGERRHARARRPAGVSSVAGFVAGPQKGLGRADL
jgi:hypothetical protein